MSGTDSITQFRLHFGSCPMGRPQNAAVTPEMWDRGSFWGYIPHYYRITLETRCMSTEFTIKTRGVQNDALPAFTLRFPRENTLRKRWRKWKAKRKAHLVFYWDNLMEIWNISCSVICINTITLIYYCGIICFRFTTTNCGWSLYLFLFKWEIIIGINILGSVQVNVNAFVK